MPIYPHGGVVMEKWEINEKTNRLIMLFEKLEYDFQQAERTYIENKIQKLLVSQFKPNYVL